MSARQYLFTSESVTEGHPDKIADQISDAVLDAIIAEDPYGRVACETIVATGLAFVAGGLVLTDTGVVTGLVACPLPPGGATVHDARTLHYAGPNSTSEPRRALLMSFACPSEPLDEPRRFPWQRPEWR